MFIFFRYPRLGDPNILMDWQTQIWKVTLINKSFRTLWNFPFGVRRWQVMIDHPCLKWCKPFEIVALAEWSFKNSVLKVMWNTIQFQILPNLHLDLTMRKTQPTPFFQPQHHSLLPQVNQQTMECQTLCFQVLQTLEWLKFLKSFPISYLDN